MPTVTLARSDTTLGSAVPVVLVAEGGRLLPGAEPVDVAFGGRLNDALGALRVTGAIDEVTRIATLGLAPFPVLVAAGVGPVYGEPTPEQIRRATGAALRSLSREARVHLPVGGVAALEGALLGSYGFTAYKSSPTESALKRISVTGASRAEVSRAQILAEAVTLARDLVNMPPQDLYPATFAQRLVAAATEAGMTTEVLDEKALRRGGYGGILGVGSGSVRPPRLVRLTYRPARARGRIALVGKGITFDSGGLNIKLANMAAMKSDMGGAAAAAGAAIAAARLKLPVEVTATLPMAENLPSGTSYRPSDVLTLRGGRTIEIADTDAEGRVVLADAIVRAVEDKPDQLLEISTLTGAQITALGMRVLGAMGEPTLRDRVVAAANAAGEAAWAMPLPDDLRPGLDSQVADLATLTGERWGSMLVGGVFLSEFVPAGLPWVHLDIAGPSWNPGTPHGYTPKGGTGSGVRTLLAAIEDLVG